jgi:hypothetical protein
LTVNIEYNTDKSSNLSIIPFQIWC